MEKKNTICIMADFGKGPYAWLRQSDELPPYVGINIANSWEGFEEEFDILKVLEEEFKQWIDNFEINCDKRDFDWKTFNDIGLRLSRNVKHIVGDKYNVEYHIPCEDPNYDHISNNTIIEIEE